MNRKNRKVIAVLIFIFVTSLLSAKESFVFKSDSSKMVMPRGKKEFILTGHARITSETLKITADEIRRFGNDLQFTICTGNVKAEDMDREIEITCEKLFFDTDKDIIRIETWSELYDKKNEVVTRSGYLLDQRQEKITYMSINVRIFRDTVVCRSEFARFDHNEGIFELTGNPVIYKDGNEMSAFRVIYNIDNDEIELIGNVSGTIQPEEEEETAEPGSEPDQAAPRDEGQENSSEGGG